MNAAQPVKQEYQLRIEKASIAYGNNVVVQDASLHLKPGEIGCLLGPSGCGKSTLLRSIAGFEPLIGGSIKMEGSILSSVKKMIPTEKRNIGMVFQDVALFPHLTIAENIAFGIKKLSKTEQNTRIKELLNVIGLPGCESRYPGSMSGGQQQRVALARALAPRPHILLLDEPFSGLDAKLRESLVPEVREILKTLNISALMVSHDQAETFAIADKVGVMTKGSILQWGTPDEIFNRPADRFVAEFVGRGEFLKGVINQEGVIDTVLGPLNAHSTGYSVSPDDNVDVLVRINNLLVDEDSDIQGTILSRTFRGAYILYRVELSNGEQLHCAGSAGQSHEIGEKIGIQLNINQPLIFPCPAN